MKTYGVIGYPLTHSFSPRYFSEKFKHPDFVDHRYIIGEISNLKDLDAWIQQEQVLGFNVTIPYKQQILPYLDYIQPAALLIDAVNCVKVIHGTRSMYELIGYNTDIPGFKISLEQLLKPHHTRALILGTGGAAAAVSYVLSKLHIPFIRVSRYPKQAGEISYADLSKDMIHIHTLLINTTPVGLYPNINIAPKIPYKYITPKHLLYDLIYNPEETLFLKRGAAQGAGVKNGYEMLCVQAEASWDFWKE